MTDVIFFPKPGRVLVLLRTATLVIVAAAAGLAQDVRAAFDPNCNGRVFTVALQRDGKILIGGEFTTVGGIEHNHLARLHSDGSVDSTFTAGADNSVYAIAMQADGQMLVGGAFAAVNGSHRRSLVRLNQQGQVDATFTP